MIISSRWRTLLVASVFTALGCGGGGGARAPETTIIRPRAVYELGCPDAQLVVTRVTGSTYSVAGCGASATYTCMGGMGNYACSREGTVEGRSTALDVPAGAEEVTASGRPVSDEVLPRARVQLGCDEVRVFEIARLTYAAHGCGGSAIYTCMGGMGQYSCQLE